MAARRLVIAMVVLLTISTTIAIIAPRRDVKSGNEATTGTTTATGTTSATGESGSGDGSAPLQAENEPISENGGTIIRETVTGDGSKGDKTGSKPQEVSAMAGDRLILTVDLGRPARIAIPGLGLTGDTTRFSPAVFDTLLMRTVPQKVIDVDSGKTLAEIVVGIPDAKKRSGRPPSSRPDSA